MTMTMAPRAVPDGSTPATDRPRRTPDSEVHFGIDTIRVAGRVADGALEQEVQRAKRTVDRRTGEVSLLIPTGSEATLEDGIRLDVRPRNGELFASAEFSAPRVLEGENTIPASLSAVGEAVRIVHSRAERAVTWLVDHSHLELRRLDIARDFTGIPDPQVILDLLGRGRVSRCTPSIYPTQGGMTTQTVYRETTRWKTRLYARGPHYRDKAHSARPEDRRRLLELAHRERATVRFEVQLRGDVLRDAGVRVLADLTEDWVWEQARHYFTRGGHDLPIGGGRRALGLAVRHALAESTASKVAGAFFESYCSSHGLAAYSPNVAGGHRRNAQEWGFNWGALGDHDGDQVRLDFDSGTLQTVASAA